jgi:hypothetical protein
MAQLSLCPFSHNVSVFRHDFFGQRHGRTEVYILCREVESLGLFCGADPRISDPLHFPVKSKKQNNHQ